jgi:hypothetical protein
VFSDCGRLLPISRLAFTELSTRVPSGGIRVSHELAACRQERRTSVSSTIQLLIRVDYSSWVSPPAEDCLCIWRGAELKPLGMDAEGGVALSPVGFEVA